MYKKYIPFLCLCALFSFVAYEYIFVSRDFSGCLTKQSVSGEKKPFSKLLLVAGTFRTGSSWLGELLAKTPNSFYVYEPMKYLSSFNDTFHGISIPSQSSIELIHNLFHCNVTKGFAKFFLSSRDLYPKCQYDRSCDPYSVIENDCQQAEIRIMKTVRLKLEATESLLTRPEYSDLKIIYLIRDPRATLTSIEGIRPELKWTLSSKEICPKLRSDLLIYDHLENKYPGRLTFVVYERIAQHFEEGATKLWRFLQDDQETVPPPEWLDYVKNGPQRPNEEDLKVFSKEMIQFDTTKKSRKEFQKWRQKITEKLLQEAEDSCHDIITILNFRHFDSLSAAQNLSLDIGLTVKTES